MDPINSEAQADTAVILRCDALTFAYAAGEPVLRDVSVALRPGRLTVLLGPNAAGKSTLLRLMLGQLEPTSGCVMLDDADVTTLSDAARAAVISYVPQRAATSFAFTVEQVVAMGRFALHRDAGAIDCAIEQTDLATLRHRVYSALSVGQQQRVLLARAIAQAGDGGKVMLLDEPGSAMDLRHVHRMMRLLTDQAARGMAVLAVLHDLNLAAAYADDVWLLDGGTVAATGAWHEVMRPSVLEPVYDMTLRSIDAGSSRPVFVADPDAPLAARYTMAGGEAGMPSPDAETAGSAAPSEGPHAS